MPNRIISESCRTSLTLDKLTDGAERLFWRLTTVADDFGRFESDPRVILANCFPLRVGVTKIVTITKLYTELVVCGLVTTYVVKGKSLGFFVTWDSYQRRRAKHSKYPSPADDNICCQALTNVAEERGTRNEESRNRGDVRRTPKPLLSVLADLWNEVCKELPQVKEMTDGRRDKERSRLKDRDFDSWKGIFVRVNDSSFCRGEGPSSWVASYDWIMSNDTNAVKVVEGKYDNRQIKIREKNF